MIITIKGATYTYNIGALDSWFISRSIGSGATYDGVTSVKKGESFSATVTIKEGYEIGSAGITITMGGIDITDTAVLTSDEVIVISISSVTGNVVINVPTKNIATGEEDEPETPVTPPSGYTLTINPTPTTATVTLTAEGYTQNGNSINVPSGTVVTYTTAAEKYKTRSNETITVTENATKEVVLAPLPYASGATVPSDGVVSENMFIKLPDTWMNGSGTSLDQILGEGTGNTIGYYCCYLPIDISGYTKIDLTAQTTAACYYQFFTADGKWTMTGTRQKIDKGASKTADIPSGAKYLLLADSRTNSTDANAVNGYLKYFPVSVKIY